MIGSFICRVTTAFEHPVAIMGVPVACVVSSRLLSETALTLLLSVLAISLTQMILYANDQDTRALHAKVDELIRAIEDADNRLIGVERQD